MIGRVLSGQYEVIRELGRGGMGIVYLGRQRSLDRPVAIKVLPPSATSIPERRAQLLAEARLLARLRHPAVVEVYDVLEEDGTVCLVMQYVEGETARDWQLSHGPDPRRAVEAGIAVCRALEAAHGQTPPIVHRDVKTANLIFTPRGEVKLLDFGLAALKTEDAAGSAEFLSPEQAEGRPLDGRSDLYSLGIVLYELSTGRLPFAGGGEFSIAYRHVHEPPAPPSQSVRSFPPSLERIILKCLSKQPEGRYASAADLRRELEVCLPGLAPQGETKSMKKIALVAVVGLLVLGGLIMYVNRQAARQGGAAPAPAPGAAETPAAVDEHAREAVLQQLTGLRQAFERGDVEGGNAAAQRLARADLSPLLPAERADYQQLTYKLASAQKKIDSASQLVQLARDAIVAKRQDEALALARQAKEALVSAVADVPHYDWQQSQLGRELSAMLSVLERPAQTEVVSATWEARLEAAMTRARRGERTDALAELQALLPGAPPARRAWLESEIARIQAQEARQSSLSAATVAGTSDVRGLIAQEQYHAGLRALDQLENKATSGAQLAELAELRRTLMQGIQRRQTDIRKEAQNLDQLLELIATEIDNKDKEQAETNLKHAAQVLAALQETHKSQPDYEVPLTDEDKRLERLSAAASKLVESASP